MKNGKKLKRTPQRDEIIKFLNGNKSHPSAYDIYKAVKKKIPSISFATVYNNLKIMVDENKLLEINDGEKLRFDFDTNPHDHFLCVRCNNIYDFPPSVKDFKYLKNFKIISHITYIKGICENCLKKEKEVK